MSVADDLFNLTEFTTNCNTAASISVFTRLDDPQLLAHSRIFCQIWMIRGRVVGLFKFAKSTICETIFNVVSQWKIVESILLGAFVVNFHVVVYSFFVWKMKIVFLVIGSAMRMTSYIFFLIISIFTRFELCSHSSRSAVTCSKGFDTSNIRKLFGITSGECCLLFFERWKCLTFGLSFGRVN